MLIKISTSYSKESVVLASNLDAVSLLNVKVTKQNNSHQTVRFLKYIHKYQCTFFEYVSQLKYIQTCIK